MVLYLPALASLLVLGVYFGLTLWLLLDTFRRGRGWVLWQLLLLALPIVAIPAWLVRRQRWPVTVSISRTRTVMFTALAAGIVVASFVFSLVEASLITTSLFQVARVEGGAMEPTIMNQDRLIVNKRVYRVGDPAIGDIVMLRYPLDPRKTFVKRVIAVGGDEVRIVNGVVFRNDVRADEPFVAEAYRSHDNWGPGMVPRGTYFVMGDHRNNSSDTREWGFVPREYMLGRIAIRWWPLSEARRF
jgi:signal peptidase I